MNALSTIGAAVATLLTPAQLPAAAPQAFTVQRCYVPPDYETAATSELKLLVVTTEEDVDLHGPNRTRSQCDHVYTVKVAMVKRVTAGDVTAPEALAELDALSDFREALIDVLKANTTQGNATLETLKNAPAAYDPATLDTKKTFVSVIALTYRLLR
jgi:hypothetical protein